MIRLKFCLSQFVMLLATIVGWLLLPLPCLLQAWKLSARSIKDGRPIDVWKWSWLNYVYGNPEDGVSGQQAIVFVNGQPQLYRPQSGVRWRAYVWGAWRNSCDNLKYVFANEKGPLIKVGFKFGYQEENGYKVPIISGFKNG